MKQSYINALYQSLVLERDYEPLQAEPGSNPFPEGILILHRYSRYQYYLVQLLDGDRFANAAIREKLESDRLWLRTAPEEGRVHLITVYIFSDPEKVAAFREQIATESGPLPSGKFFTALAVDLTEQTVIRGIRATVPADGMEKILERLVRSDYSEFHTLPTAEELAALKRREYTIHLKTNRPTVTYILIGINIAVWLLGMASTALFGGDILTWLGAKVNQLIVRGEYWRLLTPVFLHAGPLHLGVNCYSLYILGQDVERLYGHRKFLIVYLAAGLLGNIGSFVFSPHAGVGASGAIFGLLGAVLYYGIENPKVFKKYFGANVIATIILNLGFSLSIPGIDKFAHLAGLCGGFLVSGIVRVNAAPERFPSRFLMLGITVLLGLLGLWAGFRLHAV